MAHDELKTIRKIIEKTRTFMLTTVDDEGGLVSRPMTLQTMDEHNDLWVFTRADTSTVGDVTAERAVNAAFVGDSSWVSVSGTASLVRDVETKKRIWNVADEVFLDGDAEDPENLLVRIDADSARYWDSPGTVATVVRLAAATATGSDPDVGDSGTVRL